MFPSWLTPTGAALGPCRRLGRNAETVRQNYLRPLLRTGSIVMTRPDKPNNPDQAYCA